MMKVAKILAKILSLLIISGIVLHGVVPHHHHEIAGEVHTCCESHQHHDDESHSDSETPCTILSSIHFENLKPQVKVFTQELKHNHFDDYLAMCPFKHYADFHPLHAKETLFIPEAVFSETGFYHSFSHRGPPLA